MPDAATGWTTRSAWAGILEAGRSGRSGRAAEAPGLVVEPQDGFGLASIVASATGTGDLAARIADRFGLALPTAPRFVEGAEVALIWAGHRHWLARSPRQDLASFLQAKLGDVAAIADQGDSRAVLRLRGPRLREVLAKGCMIDLHPSVFASGDVALTSIGHVGVHLWRPDDDADETSFEIAVFRSLAGSFWSWLRASAAEFGLEVRLAALQGVETRPD